ncbi:MAG TPA: site-specific integrase [Pedobacter sp.]|jgi:integrase
MIGTVRIELRKGVSAKHGMTPLSLIYSLEGARKRYSLNLNIYPEYWEQKQQLAVFIPVKDARKLLPAIPVNHLLTEVEIKDINKEIGKLKQCISEIEDKFKANKKPFSSDMVINELLASQGQVTKKEEPTGFVFDFMDQYIKDHEATRQKGSLSVYKSVKNHLEAYQYATGHKVTFETIDYIFFQKFQTFLIKRTKSDKAGNISPMLNNTTIAKALSTLKTFLGYARKSGIKVNGTYKDFEIKKQSLEVIALDQDEFDAILNKDFNGNARLEKARDLLIFSCTTGLRVSDMLQLRREHINNNTITLKVTKTKQDLSIPLNVISAGILDKYKEHHRPLPMISSQNLNYYVKEIAELCGINQPIEIVRFSGTKRIVKVYQKHELIKIHTGRKTFATLSLEKGMSAEEVMKIGGWEDYQSFKRYVNITEKRKKVVMEQAWGAPVHLKVV